jgi:hypothetical protein
VLKNRWWWVQADSLDAGGVNLAWTQSRKQGMVKTLPKHCEMAEINTIDKWKSIVYDFSTKKKKSKKTNERDNSYDALIKNEH